jgi:hypothetical protein
MDNFLSTKDLIEQTGLTIRQIHWAIINERLTPIGGRNGYGKHNRFHPEIVSELILVRKRLEWGLTVDAAWREEDPGVVPTPPNRTWFS